MTSRHRFILIALAVLACGAPARDPVELLVRDLRIQVPRGWGVTWDPDSTALLFPPSDQATAVRVTGLTAVSPRPLGATAAVDWLREYQKIHGAAIESLPSGASVATTDSVFTEAGTLVHIRFWYRVQAVPPDTLHIGIISLAQQVHKAADSLRPSYVAAAEHLVRTALLQRP